MKYSKEKWAEREDQPRKGCNKSFIQKFVSFAEFYLQIIRLYDIIFLLWLKLGYKK